MPLANLQRHFVQSLIQPPVEDYEFLSHLRSVGNLNVEKQLDIYRRNLNGAHQKVLQQIYPACRNILGKEYFEQLCRLYRQQQPSTCADLNNYGHLFAYFLRTQSQCHPELAEFFYLGDLATLEWHWHSSHYAQNDLLFDFEMLEKLRLEQQQLITFQLGHAFYFNHSSFPILELWQANKDTPDAHQVFNTPNEGIYYCVYRDQFESKLGNINKTQYAMLVAIKEQHTLEQLNQAFTQDAHEYLVAFIQQGWISSFRVRD